MSEKKFKRIYWEDRVVDDSTGEVLVEGTPVNEENLNRIEEGIDEALDLGYDLKDRVEHLESTRVKRYGVRFYGSNPVGERVEDAVGMVANVAVDDEIVVNDFDNVPFFNRRICCGHFDEEGNFHVHAYRGEPGFAWDGSAGEVMYEETPFYWKGDLHTYVSVCGSPLEGYQLAPRFRDGHTKEYSPVFWSGLVDGKMTSRSGVFAEYTSLNGHMTAAQNTHSRAHTETMASLFTDWLLLLVEFATKDPQTIMMGATSMAYGDSYKAKFSEPNVNRIIIENDLADRFVIGQTIGIGSSYASDSVAKDRIVTSIVPHDEFHKAIYFDGEPVNITEGNVVSSRTWRNGVTNIIKASSGSIVSNTDGRYPCIWRGKVDPWGDAWSAICDVLIDSEEDEESNRLNHLYFLPDPTKYASGAITDDYVKLNYNPASTEGYIKAFGVDDRFPHVRFPIETGASSSTHFADYWYAPYSDGIRAVCAGGSWINGRPYGPFALIGIDAPSYSYVNRRARLFVSRA